MLIGPMSSSHAVGLVSGELMMWHKVTLDFVGPVTAEDASPNPFTDYRMNVTFTHTETGKQYLVPGYYAADGDAANTSATSGNVWRVHFAPDELGEWTYVASFRSGSNVATDDDPAAGSSAGFFDGQASSFTISPTDKVGRDFRCKGRLEYVGKHHYRFAGTGEFYMKAGTDSPENLLAYADFDGDFKTDGDSDDLIKTWAPHVQDWQPGDPVWQGDKGKGLIGAINYLASEGLNAFSFLTMNIEGDDENVFPYVESDDYERLDVSRLDQWAIVFEHGTQKGMFLHFKTQETENEKLLNNGNMGDERKLYYRELIARFGYNLALNWNLGEEINDASTSQKAAWAQYFFDHDPYNHPIVIHNGDQHFDLMGSASKVVGMSKQMNAEDFGDTFYDINRWLKKSDEEGKPWVVTCDEPGNSGDSLRPDNDPGNSHIDARRDALWATIMAGGAGIEFYFGSQYPNSDLTCEDFRSRDAFWEYCRYALEFFDENDFPFELMSNHIDLISGAGSETQSNSGSNGNRCLARIGDTYLVQLRSGGNHTLDLSAASGDFTVNWFNPRVGGALIPAPNLTGGGVVSLGSPPNTVDEDWIVLVESVAGDSGTNYPPTVSAGPDKSAFLVGAEKSVTLNGTVQDDGLPEPLVQLSWSFVSGPATVIFSNDAAAVTTATFTEAGEYVLRLHATDTDLSASDDVMVTIQLPDTGGVEDLTAVHDAFTDEGVNDNGSFLRAADGTRVTYLQFDLPMTSSPISSAILRLTEAEGVNLGDATLRLYEATSNQWDEDTIDATTAPTKGAELATFSGTVTAGQVLEFDVSAFVSPDQTYSFILEADPLSTEIAFASEENATAEARPILAVTTAPNTPPLLDDYTLATSVNKAVTLPFGRILEGASDVDEDPVTLAIEEGSTSSGGYITVAVDTFTYTPSIDFSGSDSFLLTVEDGRGGSADATMQIQVIESDGIDGNIPSVVELPTGEMEVSFTGFEGYPYELERSVDLIAWDLVEVVYGGAGGSVQYLDEAPPEGAAFYRLVSP